MLNGVLGVIGGSILARGESRRAGIARGILASYLNSAAGIAGNLVLVPLYLAYLGRDEYGLWMMVSGLVAYLGLLNLGIVQTTAVRFAGAVARGEPALASRTLATGLWSYLRMAAVALVGLLVVAPFLPWSLFVKGSPALEQRVTVVLMAAGAAFIVELPLGVFGACLRSIGRVDLQQGVGVLQNVVRAGAAVLLLKAGGTLPELIVLLSLVNVAGSALHYGCLRREFPGLRVGWRLRDEGIAGEMRSPSRYYFVLQVAGAIVFGSDAIVISSLVATSLVAPYAIAQRLAALALGAVGTISLNFAPSFLETHARGDVPSLRALFRHAMRISVVSGVLVSAGYLLAGPAFITWWVGAGNFVGRSAFLAIVGLMLVQMVLTPCDQLLVSTARHREYALAAVWEALITLLGGLAVGPVWGVVGVAWVRLGGRLIGAGPVMVWRSVGILRCR